jgi:acetate kinase
VARVRVLALNAGSSSLKVAVRDAGDTDPAVRIHAERLGTAQATLTVDDHPGRPVGKTWEAAVDAVADAADDQAPHPDVVVHRIVHGGPLHHRPTVVDDGLVADLDAVVSLAPLHQPPALDALARARRRWPGATHVACFDTGFHADLPEASRRLPVSETLHAQGVRRYGFHGLSVQSVLTAEPELRNVVVAHLGSGCSVTAVGPDRLPRYTSMSFSPDSGMMSATRAGDLDPEIMLYLIEHHGHSPADLREEINRRSGLMGVSGGHRDVRDLLASPTAASRLALDMFVASAAMTVAAAATTLESWDALVLTGGVGEHATELRDRICARLRLGDATSVQVVRADEERVMDSLARSLLGDD